MKKETAEKIFSTSQEIAKQFSDKNRAFNYTQETFELKKIIPLSENSVISIYHKSNNKLVAFYIQYINTGNGGFIQYFCIKYQHIIDFEHIKQIMQMIEQHNYPCNFDNMTTINSKEEIKKLEEWM